MSAIVIENQSIGEFLFFLRPFWMYYIYIQRMLVIELRGTKRNQMKFNVKLSLGWHQAVNKSTDIEEECCLYLFGNGRYYAITGFFLIFRPTLKYCTKLMS